MTEIQSQEADRKLKEREGEKDRAQKERASRRSLAGQFVTGITNVASTAAKSLMNDKSWYNQDKVLVDNVASLSYAAPFGNPDFQGDLAQLMVLNYVPTLPHSVITTGGANLVDDSIVTSFKALYAQIRKVNSGARNYEYQDLIKYTLAIQSMYGNLAYFRRIYSLAKHFDTYNDLFTSKLDKILNVDFNDIRKNLTNLRTTINYYNRILETFALPDVMTVVSRQVWMNSGIVQDHKLRKTQYYLFNPAGYYEITSATETSLTFKYFPHYTNRSAGTAPLTYNDIATILRDQFNLVMNDPYSAIISGDIRKRFEGKSILAFSSLAEDEKLLIITSDEVLSQIENLTCVNTNVDFTITQDVAKGLIKQEYPTKSINVIGTTSGKDIVLSNDDPIYSPILNMYVDSPTADDNMVSSRLLNQHVIGGATANSFNIYARTYGTEVIVSIDILATNKTGAILSPYILRNLDSYIFTSDKSDMQLQQDGVNLILPTGELIRRWVVWSQFDWAPRLYHGALTKTDDISFQIIIDNAMLEVKNHAVAQGINLANMNRVAALSEYGLTLLTK